MRFWKIFAWIALGWALVARRGAGVLIRKVSPEQGGEGPDPEAPEQQSGPGWRRVSTTGPATPGRAGGDSEPRQR